MQKKLYTGILRYSEALEWTVLRRSGSEIDISEHETRRFEEDGGEAAEAAPPSRGVVCAAIPMAEALVRVMRLPSVDREELAGMVDLQIGKISPFPVEELVVSFEILSSDESSSCVLIAAARRESLDRLCEIGVVPRHIDIDLLARWQGIAPLAGESGRDLVLLVASERAELVVTDNGMPILFRSLLERDDLGDADFTEAIAEELQYTLVALETDWGSPSSVRVLLVEDEGASVVEADRLAELSGIAVEDASVAASPPASELLLRRRIEAEGRIIDLTPPEWMSSARERRLKKRLLLGSAALAAIWLLTIAAVLGYGSWERSSAGRLERRAEELKGPALRSRELQSRIEALEQYADRSHSALECLREASMLLPARLELQSFNFQQKSEVGLRGLSASASAADVYTYFQALEKSDKFVALEDQRVSTVSRRGSGRVSQFQVSLKLPAGEVQP